MNRISFTQTEVGMMNEVVDYLTIQAKDIPKADYILAAIAESISVKSELLKKLLGEGVIEP